MNGIAQVEELVAKKGLPASLHMERTVLGAMLLEDSITLQDGLEQCDERCFSLDSHRRIFSAIRAVSDAGTQVQYGTLALELQKRHELTNVGGRA